MEIAKVKVTGTRAYTTEALDIPQGIVGATVSFEFGPEWAGLTKNVVFVGAKDVEILGIQDSVYLPPEVVSTPNIIVRVGVVGVDGNKKMVIPTLWADLGAVKPAAPVDMGYDPTLPIWAQLLVMIGDLRNLNTDDKSNLVAAVNEAMQNGGGGSGGYYTPVVTQPTANTMQIFFVPSVATMPTVEPVTITLPGSNSGQNPTGGGLSATASALLIKILKNVSFYDADQSANITALENVLFNGGTAPDTPDTPDEPDVPEVTKYTIVSALLHATSNNASASVESGASYTATITAEDGYTLDGATVSVSMGGVDITATAYANGVVNITSVTGNVIITVNAVSIATIEILYELPEPTTFDGTNSIDTGVSLFDKDKDWSIVLDVETVTPPADIEHIIQSKVSPDDRILNLAVSFGTSNPRVYFSSTYKKLGSLVWVGQKAGNTAKMVLTHIAGTTTVICDYYFTNVAGKNDIGHGEEIAVTAYPVNDGTIYIGVNKSGAFMVNDLKIYNRVLTDDEIAAYLEVA